MHICAVRQAWATGEIWRNLGELDASYVAGKLYQSMPICDWILEKRSKSHIRSSEINGFKELKPA